jgi:hypothetical protein
MNGAYHPIVDELLPHLMGPNPNSTQGLELSEQGSEALTSKLLGMTGNMDDFRNAIRDLVTFSNFLHEMKSPKACDGILGVIAENPEVVRYANLATREEGQEQREQIGDKFAKFTDSTPAHEEAIETTEPSVSALSLLKGRMSV